MLMQNKNYTQKILFRQQKYPTSLKFNHKGYQEKFLFHKDLDVESTDDSTHSISNCACVFQLLLMLLRTVYHL